MPALESESVDGGTETPERESFLAFAASALCGGRNVRRMCSGMSPRAAVRRARLARSLRPSCGSSSPNTAAGVPEGEVWDETHCEGSGGGLELLATPRKLRPYLRRGRGLFFLLSSLVDNATDMVLMATTLAVVLAAVKTQVALSLHGQMQWSCPPTLVTNYSCASSLHSGTPVVGRLRGDVLRNCSYSLAHTAVRLRYSPFLSPADAALGMSDIFGSTAPPDDVLNSLLVTVNKGNGTGSECFTGSAAATAIPASCADENVKLTLTRSRLHPSLTLGTGATVGLASLTTPLFGDGWGSVLPCPYAPAYTDAPEPAPAAVDAAVTFERASGPKIAFQSGPRAGQKWTCHPLVDATEQYAIGSDFLHNGCTAAPVQRNGTALCGLGTVPDYVRVCGPGPANDSVPATFTADTGKAGLMHASLVTALRTAPNRTAPYTHLCAPDPVFHPPSSGSTLANDLRYSAGVCTGVRKVFDVQGDWILALSDSAAWPITASVSVLLGVINLPLLGAATIYCAPSIVVNALFMMILFMAGQELLGLALVAAALLRPASRSRMAITVFAKRSIAAAVYLAVAYVRTPRAWERLDRRVLLERRAQLRAFRGSFLGLRRNPKVPDSHWPPLFVRLLLFFHLIAELGQILFSSAIALSSLLALGPESETRGGVHRAFAGLSLLLSVISIGRTAADWWTAFHHRHCCFGFCCGCYTLWRCCCVRGPFGCVLCFGRCVREWVQQRSARAARARAAGDYSEALLSHADKEGEDTTDTAA